MSVLGEWSPAGNVELSRKSGGCPGVRVCVYWKGYEEMSRDSCHPMLLDPHPELQSSKSVTVLEKYEGIHVHVRVHNTP